MNLKNYAKLLLALVLIPGLGILTVHTTPGNAPIAMSADVLATVYEANSVDATGAPNEMSQPGEQSMVPADLMLSLQPGADSIHLIRALISALETQQASMDEQKSINRQQARQIESLKAINYSLRQTNRSLREETEVIFFELESAKALEENLRNEAFDRLKGNE